MGQNFLVIGIWVMANGGPMAAEEECLLVLVRRKL